MKEDRLRKDYDEIHNLDDIIDAHDERTSHMTGDIDSLQEDIEIPEDLDVDEALTFPHPKHKKKVEDVELMSTRHKEDIDQTWEASDQDIQHSDYEDHYDDATDTYATDNMDEVYEEQVHDMGEMTPDDLYNEPTVEVMPRNFTPDEETTE